VICIHSVLIALTDFTETVKELITDYSVNWWTDTFSLVVAGILWWQQNKQPVPIQTTHT